MKAKVQSFGRFLSGMVMPNIGAFYRLGPDYGFIHSQRLAS